MKPKGKRQTDALSTALIRVNRACNTRMIYAHQFATGSGLHYSKWAAKSMRKNRKMIGEA